ncbi:hypothetical protein Lalb_Chr07g0186171 [Lupinus albus]|uniref:Uncharacterized protein n=1 Tax=Lupinus albus TaxID=3870 RepID=A0A6A4Q905_LUPAL|nr:hypothetical protein Lalb_Chr07g0186171 [Lupinus albus]
MKTYQYVTIKIFKSSLLLLFLLHYHWCGTTYICSSKFKPPWPHCNQKISCCYL